MTKLEEKLIELGYKLIFSNVRWFKDCDSSNSIFIITDNCHENIKEYHIYVYDLIETQQDIDNIQQAYNEMQKDLEVLKECE